jgi:hypothetical protein
VASPIASLNKYFKDEVMERLHARVTEAV